MLDNEVESRNTASGPAVLMDCRTDGFATVFTFGGVYAAGTFNMSQTEVLPFGMTLGIFVGPLLVGAVTAATGSQRWGMSTILAFFAVG